MAQEKVSVTELEVDINSLLEIPGISSEPGNTEEKKNIFSSNGDVFNSFLNEDLIVNTETKSKESVTTEEKVLDTIVQETTPNLENEKPEEDPLKSESGRPKLTKDALVSVTSKLIEKGVILPFDEAKPLEEYSSADFEELIEANLLEREKKLKEEIPVEFFDSLPEPLKIAAQYAADGGQDFKGLFRSLAGLEEVKSLDPNDETDAVVIVRSYLQATNFGTSTEIEEEIEQWADNKQIVNKALKFKPKLDSMQESIVNKQVEEQEKQRIKNQQKAKEYTDNVYSTIEKGELNGIKIDKKLQADLFNGLVRAEYQSVSGKQINKLGHLLEKYQIVEPNLSLVAEALWLLSDPTGYKSKIKEIGETTAAEKTVRMLKQEQSNKGSGTAENVEEGSRKPDPKKIPRPSTRFFKRQ